MMKCGECGGGHDHHPGCGIPTLQRKFADRLQQVRQASDHDSVNHPAHYKRGGFECLDVIEALGLSYHLGNVLKYLWRAGHKQGAALLEDLRKARFYLDRAITRIEQDKSRS